MSTKTRATRPHFHLPTLYRDSSTRPSTAAPTEAPPIRRVRPPRLLHVLVPILAAVIGVAVLWIAVDQGTQSEAPPTPGVTQFDSAVPAGIDGSDWHLYLRGQERAATLQAQQESAYGSDVHLYNMIPVPEVVTHGSDQRLYNRAAEIAAAQQALQESAYGSDVHLYNMAAER